MISIREIEYSDIDRGFLEVLDNLFSPNMDNEYAKNILKHIKSNQSHKIFVAIDDTNDRIVGTTTLIVEQKFINKGMKVGYIEDVSIRKGYEGKGIGRQIVSYTINNAKIVQKCKKILLYCSNKNKLFYEKLRFKPASETSVMILEF